MFFAQQNKNLWLEVRVVVAVAVTHDTADLGTHYSQSLCYTNSNAGFSKGLFYAFQVFVQ